MKKITQILIKAGIFKINDHTLKRWAKQKKISGLIYALKNAHYTSRTYAATLLSTQAPSPTMIDALMAALDDPMSYVSLEAIHTLEKIGVPIQHQTQIEEKKAYWAKLHPCLVKLKSKVNGSMAGFHNSSIPSPEGFIGGEHAISYGVM